MHLLAAPGIALQINQRDAPAYNYINKGPNRAVVQAVSAPVGWASPSIAERREEPAARVAHYASLRAKWRLIETELAAPPPCFSCGDFAGGWCNTCETNNVTPLLMPGYGHLFTPMCDTCDREDYPCTACKVRPSEGPLDSDFATPQLTQFETASIFIPASFRQATELPVE